MKDYITLKEAANNWEICERRIRTLCVEGRIEGAEKIGPIWTIPQNAVKPKDNRIKSGKHMKTETK